MTNIAWTDETWNPLRARNKGLSQSVGWACVRVSGGCKNCYAAKQNRERRWGRGTGLDYTVRALDGVDTYIDDQTLTQPFRWKKPRRAFVCSMTDLFGEWVTDEQIDRVFSVMREAMEHTFQVLTKRPERMRQWTRDYLIPRSGYTSNVWLGVSVEDQAAADERIPVLLDTPAAVRFISAEPLLGPVNAEMWMGWQPDALHTLDWVIVGGESGPGWRPMEHEWAAYIQRQCDRAGIAYFGKQDAGARPGIALPSPLNAQAWPEATT